MTDNLDLTDDHFCFVCGRDNPDGLRIQFQYPEKGVCRAEFVPLQKFQGWKDILHGGIVSTLLDEALAHAVGGPARSGGGSYSVTAELTVRFKRPVPIGQLVILEGRVIRDKGKVIECESSLKDMAGVELASATGKLIRPR
ncbi:MAG: PaaI family thioesterase [Candidatus Edwardsbacteria bacterium]|nr:PaaI family thioesterase [Candidatus Edwardsbacteria bacterium]